MTETRLERVLHKPNPWITLIPLWILSSVTMLIIGAVAILITATAAPKYHMTWSGEPILLVSKAPPQSQHPHARADPDYGRARNESRS